MNTIYNSSSPLDQFEIRDFISLNASLLNDVNISLTNIGLYLIIASFIIINFNMINNNLNKLISNS